VVELKSEHELSQLIRLEAMKYNCVLMRNNSGVLPDKNGRPVRFGLMNDSKALNDQIKSSDLIGFTKVIITPDMVGKVLAIFTAIEVKKEDWNESKKLDKRETAQSNFINWIKNNGGVGGFCNCVNKLKDIFKI
jgi:hypothetical protein